MQVGSPCALFSFVVACLCAWGPVVKVSGWLTAGVLGENKLYNKIFHYFYFFGMKRRDTPIASVEAMRRLWTVKDTSRDVRTVVPLRPRAASEPTGQPQPQVILCHDMMGNYLVDAEHQSSVAVARQFSFHYWQLVDVFIYFSHERCSVPTTQWIDAAHTNGVKVLGTFITEWEEGRKDNRAVLERDPSTGQFVLLGAFGNQAMCGCCVC